jgi:hypothetical protein
MVPLKLSKRNKPSYTKPMNWTFPLPPPPSPFTSENLHFTCLYKLQTSLPITESVGQKKGPIIPLAQNFCSKSTCKEFVYWYFTAMRVFPHSHSLFWSSFTRGPHLNHTNCTYQNCLLSTWNPQILDSKNHLIPNVSCHHIPLNLCPTVVALCQILKNRKSLPKLM